MKKNRLIILFVFILLFVSPVQALSAPYFYIDTSLSGTNATEYVNKNIYLYLTTDSSTITAAQTVVNFDEDYLEEPSDVTISILNSECDFWAPADPSLGFGNTPAPYFYNDNKVVISCGFSNPGYDSGSGGGLIARIAFYPTQIGDTTMTFSDTLFRYIGNTITPGTSPEYDLTILDSSASAQPSPTPSVTPTPSASPETSSTPTSASDSAIVVTDTLEEGDLNFVEIGVNNNVTQTNDEDVTLEIVEEDNTIPGPPANLERRPNASPFSFLNFLQSQQSNNDQTNSQDEGGDVLSAQSLRELLIPGKSKADKTVVLINFISTLTFVILLAIVIWRLVSITRMNKLRTAHLRELLASELSTIESKLGSAKSEQGSAQLKQDLGETVEKLSQEIKET